MKQDKIMIDKISEQDVYCFWNIF